MDQLDLVILVNERDETIGVMPKLEAHQKGVLHRAISVFIFNNKHELLIQQRALNKYHSAGLWSNTCCSHPMVEEDTMAAANRRLFEEMGMTAMLTPVHTFLYHEPLENGLTEHEFDHVFIGISDELPKINTEEVADYKFISIEELQREMVDFPEKYTIWFRIILPVIIEKTTQLNLIKPI